MCLIIAPGKDGKPALLPRDVFDYAYSRNNDGYGAMWVEDGRVQHFKQTGLSADEIYSAMEERVARNPEAIFHLRLRTHGKVIPGLSHPFRILNKKRHGKDLFFMHNGMLSGFGNNLTYGQSDTTAFKDKILVPLLTRDPDALDDPDVWGEINKMTSGSRLVFMDNEGNTKITSESSWNQRYGLTLSNTYMLPSVTPSYQGGRIGFHSPISNDYDEAISSKEMTVTGHFVYFRVIDRASVTEGHWVSCPKIGYIRTESGMLYKDNGPNKKIYHAANYVPKDQEFKHLGLTIVKPTTEDLRDYGSPVMAGDLDDDVPWDDAASSPSVDRSESRSGPAPEEQRLRYARLINNTYAGQVTSRIHLLADLIGMGDKELLSFVDEDYTTASTILAELIEMVIEYNDELWNINPNCPKVLNADELIRIGQPDYHRDSMMEVSKMRRAAYEEQVKKINEILETPDDEEEVNVA